MARATTSRGEAARLTVRGTGIQAMRVLVTGRSGGAESLIAEASPTASAGTATCNVEVDRQQLETFDELCVEPVLYGDEGATYELTVTLDDPAMPAADRTSTVRGELTRTRQCSVAGATGCDAPMVLFELARHRAKSAGAPASALEELDLSYDFPLGDRVSALPNVVEAKAYPVWYGTNRQRVLDKSGKLTGFSAFRDAEVHYGKAVVHIPQSHDIGSIGSPLWKRILRFEDDRLKLQSLESMAADAFWSGLASQIEEAEKGKRHGVVFLHGYNVSFEEAAIRAAQLGCDLSINSAMAFYSWPSRGSTKGYFADEATVQASAKYVTEFLEQFVRRAGAEKVHVIAHSMGNRAALEAVRDIVDQAGRSTKVPFSQFILAAPDVDAEYFKQFADGYRRIASRTTMYVSDRDYAVQASEFLHGSVPRVGLAPPFQIVNGIDTVYAGKVDESLLGHGYVASAWQLLNDMHQMIHLDAAPEDRAWVQRSTDQQYWVLKGVV